MIVELSSGYVGTSAQPAAFRGAARLALQRVPGAPAPTQAFIRDSQGLAPGGRLAGALASVGGAARGVSEAEALLARAGEGVAAVAAVLDDMKVLADAAAESTVSDVDRAILHDAFNALRDEIAAVVDRTAYDGVRLLDGDGGTSRSFSFVIGGSAGNGSATIEISAATAANLAAGLDSATLLGFDDANDTAALVDTAIEAADGLAAVRRAASGRAAAAGVVNAVVGAGMGTARDDLLEIRGIADQARQTAIKVTGDAGISLFPRDRIAAGDSLLSSLPGVPSSDGEATSAGDGDTGGGGEDRNAGDSAPARKTVDIRV